MADQEVQEPPMLRPDPPRHPSPLETFLSAATTCGRIMDAELTELVDSHV